MDRKLWYSKPAVTWEEALPLGNGRIGAMAYSGTLTDRFQINEDTLWSGYPNMVTQKHSMSEIEEIRELVKNKKYHEATEKTSDMMLGVRSQCYLSYGNIFVDIINSKGEICDYIRELDIASGTLRTEFTIDGGKVVKEAFVSLADDVLAIRVKSENPLEYHIYQSVELENKTNFTKDTVITEGRCPTYASSVDGKMVKYEDDKESIHFCSRIKAVSDTDVLTTGNSLWIDGTTELVVLFSIKTSFNGYDKMPVSEGKEYIKASDEVLAKAADLTFDELKNRHITEYKKFFDRVRLNIDGENFDMLPTDERIKNAAGGTVDNGLVVLLFDYSRYLTISSSMEGTQPGNLQGIWNYKMLAPWHCNYTMNINTQMNYWAAETCNLSECHMPYLKMLSEFAEKGNNFGLRGWSAWHNSDIWRFNCEATKGVQWGFWMMGGFWGVRHIWEHYIHTRDKSVLEEYYPVMVGACEFCEDWMYENENGELITCPSTSAENSFVYDGEVCAVCEGSAMDMSIIYDLFDKTIKAAEILGKDTEHFKNIFSRLAPVRIGKDGRILEWGDELEEYELGHRHISHLYGFYPSDIFNSEEYTKAVDKTLTTRLENGGGHTGWSNAWIAVVYARLKNGEKVMEHIRNMFKKSIYPNMFDAHPPFQIDGNFGIAAAICEALIQSHNGTVDLIPAIPPEWTSGEVSGLVTRTGETISFKWENGRIKQIFSTTSK